MYITSCAFTKDVSLNHLSSALDHEMRNEITEIKVIVSESYLIILVDSQTVCMLIVIAAPMSITMALRWPLVNQSSGLSQTLFTTLLLFTSIHHSRHRDNATHWPCVALCCLVLCCLQQWFSGTGSQKLTKTFVQSILIVLNYIEPHSETLGVINPTILTQMAQNACVWMEVFAAYQSPVLCAVCFILHFIMMFAVHWPCLLGVTHAVPKCPQIWAWPYMVQRSVI